MKGWSCSRYSKMTHWKVRWHRAAMETNWRNAKRWLAHLPWACLHMAQGRAPLWRLCPHPRHLRSNGQRLRVRTTSIMAALQKLEQISTDFSYKLIITIKWGGWPPEGLQLELHKTRYVMPWPLPFYSWYFNRYQFEIAMSNCQKVTSIDIII